MRGLKKVLAIGLPLISLPYFGGDMDLKSCLALRYKHPVSHIESVLSAADKYAALYGLRPTVVVAIIENESAYSAKAERVNGCIGLMQIHYPSWGRTLKELKIARTKEDLKKVENGINAGCYVLRFLLDRNGMNYTRALNEYVGHSTNNPTHYSRTVLARADEIASILRGSPPAPSTAARR